MPSSCWLSLLCAVLTWPSQAGEILRRDTHKYHLGRIVDKRGAASRAEVLLRAIAEGVLVPEHTDLDVRMG